MTHLNMRCSDCPVECQREDSKPTACCTELESRKHSYSNATHSLYLVHVSFTAFHVLITAPTSTLYVPTMMPGEETVDDDLTADDNVDVDDVADWCWRR